MRLKTLTVAGFRGFAREETIDLDAEAIIVVGANGSGKTSMFDAVLWALTGSIERLHGEAADVVSKYSPSGEARVTLEVQRANSSMRIIRRFDGTDHLTVEDDDEGSTSDDAARALLIDLLWPDGRAASDPNLALSRSLTRATYLQQDVVRQFVDTDDEQQRFEVVSELIGVGRVTELQRAMEGSRKAWSEATNRLGRDLEELRGRVAPLEERLRRLAPESDSAFQSEEFDRWIGEVTPHLPDEASLTLPRETSEAVETAVSLLQANQRQEERTRAALQRLMDHLETTPPEVIAAEPLRAQVHAAESLVAEASEQLRLAQEQVAGERRRQAELRDVAESLRTLAQLALRHLGERCPVCDQDYDVDSTRARLEEFVGQAQLGFAIPADSVQVAATQLEQLQRNLASIQAALRQAETSEANRASWEETLNGLAQDAGLPVSSDLLERARRRTEDSRKVVANLQRLRSAGEQFSLQLARATEQVQRSELATQLAELQRDLARRQIEWEARSQTGELASDLITALRGAGNAIVSEELNRIDPLLQRIYATVDPHPSFRVVRFLAGESRGHGRVWTTLTDEAERKTVTDPSVVLSSSQLNVLAVSTFLALNLAIDSLPLQVVALDDPLQSLDTVNLLGLADLLRRVRASRQVIVSTHDSRLASLLSRKLRPTQGTRTRVVELDAWSRTGPGLHQSDVPSDTSPLKLVASA